MSQGPGARADEVRLDDAQLREALATVRDWQSDGTSITRTFTLRGWKSALRFVNRIAEAATAADHHPDIHVERYKHVRVVLTTHACGGIARADIDLARTIDGLVEEHRHPE